MAAGGMHADDEPLRDRLRVQSFPHQREDLPLPASKPRPVRPATLRRPQSRRVTAVLQLDGTQLLAQRPERGALDHHLARGRVPDGSQDVGERAGLGEKAGGSSGGGSRETASVGASGEYEDKDFGVARLDPPSAFNAVVTRQLYVHKHDVGDMPGYLLKGVIDRPGCAQTLQVWLGSDGDLEGGGQCSLILHDQDSGHPLPSPRFFLT